MADDVEVVPVLKKSFKALIDEPGFIALYVLPLIVGILPIIYVFLSFGTANMGGAIRQVGIQAFFMQNIIWIIIFFISLIILGLTALAAVILKAEARERGNSIGFSESLTRGINYVPKIFTAGLLALLIIIGPFFAFVPLMMITPIIGILGMLIWIIPMIYIGIRLSLFPQACIIEDIGPIDGLKKTWAVTKGNFWLIFVVIIIFVLISMAISIIPSIVSPFLGQTIGSIVGGLITGPATLIAFTLVYLGISGKGEQ